MLRCRMHKALSYMTCMLSPDATNSLTSASSSISLYSLSCTQTDTHTHTHTCTSKLLCKSHVLSHGCYPPLLHSPLLKPVSSHQSTLRSDPCDSGMIWFWYGHDWLCKYRSSEIRNSVDIVMCLTSDLLVHIMK